MNSFSRKSDMIQKMENGNPVYGLKDLKNFPVLKVCSVVAGNYSLMLG